MTPSLAERADAPLGGGKAFRPARRWGLLVGLCFFLCQLPDISTYPLVGADEALLNDPGRQLLQHHEFKSDVLRMLPGYAGFYFWQPPGLALAVCGSYRLFGFGIWQTRLPGICFGALAVALAYGLVRRAAGSERAALFSAVLLCLWPPFLLTAKGARMDTGAISCLLWATTLVVDAEHGVTRNPRRGFAAGLLAGCAGLFHPIAIIWAGGLAGLLLTGARKGFRAFPAFIIGAALPVLPWLGFAWKYPYAFQQQFLTQLFGRIASGSLRERAVAEAARYGLELAHFPAFYLGLAIAVYGGVKQRVWNRPGIRELLVLFCLLAFAQAVSAGKGSGFYSLYPLTVLFCLIGIGVDFALTYFERIRASRPRLWAVRAAFALLLLNGFLFAYAPRAAALAEQGNARDYWAVMRPLSEKLRPGDHIWGSAVLWYAAVRAGATLDSEPEPVPAVWQTRPDPHFHRFVAIPGDPGPRDIPGYQQITEIHAALPKVHGRQFSNTSYFFYLYESKVLGR